MLPTLTNDLLGRFAYKNTVSITLVYRGPSRFQFLCWYATSYYA